MINSAGHLLAAARASETLIVTAESCTGGMVAATITDVAGSSAIFERGFVTYSNAAKTEELGVSPDLISEHGAVSEEVALAMARGALENSDANLAVSVTGIAGPGGSDFKPEGMVCFAIATPSAAHAQTQLFGPLGRAAVRSAARDHAIALLIEACAD